MEELLNKLIEKGWKPYGYKVKDMGNWTPEQPCKWLERTNMEDGCTNVRSYRDICSKESGLWQFVCENKLAISYKGRPLKKKHPEWHKFEDSNGEEVPFSSTCDFLTKYRLIESALKDESELEEFLLQSIVIDNEQTNRL